MHVKNRDNFTDAAVRITTRRWRRSRRTLWMADDLVLLVS
jgi:hypothetical protein